MALWRKLLLSLMLVALSGGGAVSHQLFTATSIETSTQRDVSVRKLHPLRSDAQAFKKSASDCVVLLHGLGKSSWSMWWLAQQLDEDYHVVNQSYPSLSQSIELLSEPTISASIRECQLVEAGKIHFVTHSMGGILLRHYLTTHTIENLGRVVMLGPPNRGSEVIDHLADDFPWVLNRLGPAAKQLTTNSTGITHTLGAVDFEVGVIAGHRSVNPFLSTWLPGRDDGKVSIVRTQVRGMQDFIVVPVSHPMLMWRSSVIVQVKSFLATGYFST